VLDGAQGGQDFVDTVGPDDFDGIGEGQRRGAAGRVVEIEMEERIRNWLAIGGIHARSDSARWAKIPAWMGVTTKACFRVQ
jgi:hypothetical protein